MRVTWKLAQSVLPSAYHTPTVNISNFWIILLVSHTDLLDSTKLGHLFQIKDPGKCTELVP